MIMIIYVWGYSEKRLYIKAPIAGYNLPEFISYDGDPMLLMKFGKGFVSGLAKKKLMEVVIQKAEKAIEIIAFTKLKKGIW